MRPRSSARHRTAWSPVRDFGGREALAAGVLALGAVLAVGVDDLASAQNPAPALAAATVRPGSPVSADLTASSSVGLAPTAQDPVAAVSDAPAPGVVPVTLSIPAIGLHVDLTELGERPDGSLAPPVGLLEAGWYSGSAVPGAVGPAVIAGHVDDTEQAGIFARLRELTPGAVIAVTLSDGSAREFVVDRAVDTAKADFPTDAVYGATPDPQLRLITCNGPYDFEQMHYRNNLVLFASAQHGSATS